MRDRLSTDLCETVSPEAFRFLHSMGIAHVEKDPNNDAIDGYDTDEKTSEMF